MGQQINSVEVTAEMAFLSPHALADNGSSGRIATLNPPVKLFSKKLALQQADADINDAQAQKNSRFFANLNGDIVHRLLSHAKLQSTRQGEQIIAHGDEVDFLYYLLDGQVSICRSSVDGRDTPICLLESGDTFMESVIFMAGASPFNVIALSPCQLAKIPVAVVKQQAAVDGQLRTNILRIAAQRQQHAMQHIDSLITRDALDRLGYFLLKQHLKHNPDTLKIDIGSRKTIIASHLGMKPETFSRAVQKLRTVGINVSADKRFIVTLRDHNSLCRFCDAETASSCNRYRTPRCKRPSTPNNIKTRLI